MSDVIVPGWYKDQWANQIIVRYQNRGHILKGTTMGPIRIDGKKFYFLRTASMEAALYAKGDSIVAINPDDDTIEMQSSEWDAPYDIYDFDASRIAATETDARQQQATSALGRRADRIIYDAIMAAPLDGSQIFGSYANAFDPYVFLAGLEKLADSDVDVTDDGGIYAPLPSKAFYQCQTYKIFANSQWQGGDLPLTKRVKHKTFDTAHSFILPPHLRKAYTAGTDLRFRVWHKSAVGAGANDTPRVEWIREGTKKRWKVNHTLDGVAVAVQTEGIVEFRMKADSAIDAEVIKTEEVGA